MPNFGQPEKEHVLERQTADEVMQQDAREEGRRRNEMFEVSSLNYTV